MKAACYLLPLLFVNTCFAQATIVNQPSSEQSVSRGDPTMPSASIRERLQAQAPAAPIAETPTTQTPAAKPLPALPEFDLKAIVLADADRGTALLQCNERTIVVPLARLQTNRSSTAPKSTGAHTQPERLRGFTVQGQTFVVEDFSRSTLLLRTGERTLLVQ